MTKKAHLTEGPVWRTILGMTGPMTVGMVGMVAFNLIDTFFIGKLGTEPLAAMGYSLSVVMFQGAISMGLGVGASALISRAIGRGDHPLVQRLTVDATFYETLAIAYNQSSKTTACSSAECVEANRSRTSFHRWRWKRADCMTCTFLRTIGWRPMVRVCFN